MNIGDGTKINKGIEVTHISPGHTKDPTRDHGPVVYLGP